MRICWIINSTTPYHAARMNALARALPERPALIEWTDYDEFGVLAHAGSSGEGYERSTLFPGRPLPTVPAAERKQALWRALEAYNPSAVCVNGWGMQSSRLMLAWCLGNRCPAIVMSESTEHDMDRVWWKEQAKRSILRLFSAAVVGGAPHIDYIQRLGFPSSRVFTTYNAVDNAYFATQADAVRGEVAPQRQALGLPERYFISCSRFTPKKNLPRLLAGYREYRSGSADPWDLVMLGDGPGRAELEAIRAASGLASCVHMPGAIGYRRIPAYYALASGFVHASTSEQWGLVVNEAMASGLPVAVSSRCGCAPDLVREGVNGFTFDPEQPSSIADALSRLAEGAAAGPAMGQASRALVANFAPERFAEGVVQAARVAISSPRSGSWLREKLLLALG